MAKGKGVGQGVGQKDGTRLKGQWGGVGTFVKGGRALVKGGQGLGSGSCGDSDITQTYILRGIL